MAVTTLIPALMEQKRAPPPAELKASLISIVPDQLGLDRETLHVPGVWAWWWHIPLVPAFWRQRHEDFHECKASLVYKENFRPVRAT